MSDEFELDTDDLTRRMDGALSALRTEFASLRTGRASGSMLEPIQVEAYGQMTPINQLGTVNVPEFGNTEPGPEWTIEGHGVDPDVEVDNDVASVLRGEDPQLEKAVELLLQQIAAEPRPLPEAPPAPVKTGR